MLSEGNDDDDDEGDGDAASDYVWRVQPVSGLMLQPLLAFLPRTRMVRRFGFAWNLLTGLATIPCEVLIRPASGWSRRARHRLPAACIDSRGQSGHGARLLDVGAYKLPAMGFFFHIRPKFTEGKGLAGSGSEDFQAEEICFMVFLRKRLL